MLLALDLPYRLAEGRCSSQPWHGLPTKAAESPLQILRTYLDVTLDMTLGNLLQQEGWTG